ncbi:MAG: hypothetical protein KC619_16120 [Myxococcales bacterium]|nr:hypothetical protein [Myxococcales bacterium]
MLGASTATAQEPEVLPGDASEVQRLAGLAAQLGETDAARREAAREAYAALTTDDLPAIRGRIDRIRRGRPPANWAVDILNRFRRRGRGEDGEIDLVAGAMAELAEEHRLPHERERVVAMAEPAFLWAALDAMETLEAQRAVFGLIGIDEGQWRPEGRNWVRRRGTELVAAALYARGDGDRFVREWGRYAFDTTGAEQPGRVIPSVDPERLPDVLGAYADARVQSAMRVVVSYTGHSRRAIRRAARDAMATYGGNAIWILRTAHRNETGEHPPREWGWEQVAAAIYAHQDARRMEPVQAGLDAGRAAREAGDLEAMRASYDDVLARMPELESPGEVASGYALLGAREAAEGNAARAEADYRRALRLAPQHAEADAWRAGLVLLSAQRRAAGGVWDEAAFQRVLTLAPSNEAAAAALEQLRPSTAGTPPRDDSPARARWGMAAALLLALLGLALLWRPSRAPADAVDPHASTLDPTIDDTIDEADVTLPDAA